MTGSGAGAAPGLVSTGVDVVDDGAGVGISSGLCVRAVAAKDGLAAGAPPGLEVVVLGILVQLPKPAARAPKPVAGAGGEDAGDTPAAMLGPELDEAVCGPIG